MRPTLLSSGDVCVDMGEPILEGPAVPTTLPQTQVRLWFWNPGCYLRISGFKILMATQSIIFACYIQNGLVDSCANGHSLAANPLDMYSC